ncbi:MAG: hypothetical protein HYS44_00105 [Candidatus Niyogibacteria bacterium]|nr:hypothetical protein [Candidatus Niyogibacteria bacterium]
MESKKMPTGSLMRSFDLYSQKLRNERPRFIRFKDGKLIKHALTYLTEFQIEMLFVWFLQSKKNMRPTIGAALCKEVIADFIRESSREYGFYARLEKTIFTFRGASPTPQIRSADFKNAFEKLARSFDADRRSLL